MRKIIYIAGPYRSNKGWEGVFQNIIVAREAARKLWKSGYAVICPHMNSAFMDGSDIEEAAFLEGDLSLVRASDAIFMLPGWSKSVGAQGEYEAAKKYCLEIHFSPEAEEPPKS